MKNATSTIRQMRADVDKLATQQSTPPAYAGEFVERVVILRDGGMSMRIRLRKLHLGEKLRNGDLWLDQTGTLRELPHRWYRAFVGRVGPDSLDHYRIAP